MLMTGEITSRVCADKDGERSRNAGGLVPSPPWEERDRVRR
jgi:hypothetical protein